jgi:hypothetical protein
MDFAPRYRIVLSRRGVDRTLADGLQAQPKMPQLAPDGLCLAFVVEGEIIEKLDAPAAELVVMDGAGKIVKGTPGALGGKVSGRASIASISWKPNGAAVLVSGGHLDEDGQVGLYETEVPVK